ncbi:MAG: DUF2029 domain-containing protein, partial [Phycisphaerales bacterium]|nr:DUF2029 domain-containing protein [Phycisphaerales bacterium]
CVGAGVCLGGAAAFRGFPVLVLPYLLWKRRWTAAGGMAAAALVLTLVVPGLFRGMERNAGEVGAWARGMVLKAPEAGIAQRAGAGFDYGNQSLMAWTHRVLRDVEAGDGDGTPFRINVASLSAGAAQGVFAGLAAGLGGLFVWFMLRRREAPPEGEGIEGGMLLALVAVASPLAWTYYFVWLMPGWAAAVWFVFDERTDRRRARLGGVLGLVVLAVLLSAATQNFDQRLQAIGVTLWGAVALVGLLGWMLSLRRGGSAAGGTP